ncbi:MAG: hypothetical protein RLZZ624_899 [Cyanobacteriota bacterium]|jgi:sec-independent protein translocase protein TatA
MNVFGIGLPELAVIAAIGLLVFGPKRLPELGKTLGRTLRGFQSASQEFEQEFRTAIAPVEEAAKAVVLTPATESPASTDAAEADLAAGPSEGGSAESSAN